jgi:prepilin-type processing-associated H-X9-DG protein
MISVDSAAKLQSELTRALEGVDGFLHLGEAWALHEHVRQFMDVPDLTVVEIGSWKGRSTISMALALKARGSGRLYAIDPHTGSREHILQYGAVDTYREFLANLEKAGIKAVVAAIRESSHSARSQFGDGTVNVLFVDGSHEYEDVLRDIRDWTPALANPAIVAFNDPITPGVYRALKEAVLTMGSPFRVPRLVQNTLFMEFRPKANWVPKDRATLWRLRVVLLLLRQAVRFRPYMPDWIVRLGYAISQKLV